MRLLLTIAVACTPACSCGASDDAARDAGVGDVGATDSALVDVQPRDAALPCEGTVSLIPVDADDVPDAVQRSHVLAARSGDGLALRWFNDTDTVSEDAWMAGLVVNASMPRVTALPPLPLPRPVALHPSRSGVQLLLQDTEGGSLLPRGAWVDFDPATGFGPLHRFEVATEGLRLANGSACAGGRTATFFLLSEREAGVAAVQRTPDDEIVGFEPYVTSSLGGTDVPERRAAGVRACVNTASSLRALALGPNPSSPPVVVSWDATGALLRTEAVDVGSEAGDLETTMVAAPEGPLAFVFGGGASPHIRAYRVREDRAEMIAERELERFEHPEIELVGVLPQGDGRWVIAYSQRTVLSVLGFDVAGGFGPPAVVANVLCEASVAPAVQTAGASYLALQCPFEDQLALLRVCGG